MTNQQKKNDYNDEVNEMMAKKVEDLEKLDSNNFTIVEELSNKNDELTRELEKLLIKYGRVKKELYGLKDNRCEGTKTGMLKSVQRLENTIVNMKVEKLAFWQKM